MELQKLTSEEIQTLQLEAAQRILAGNANILVEINIELINAIDRLGKARVELEKWKSTKSVVIEQNRCLKSVISGY